MSCPHCATVMITGDGGSVYAYKPSEAPLWGQADCNTTSLDMDYMDYDI